MDFETRSHHQGCRGDPRGRSHAFPKHLGLPLAPMDPSCVIDPMQDVLHGPGGLDKVRNGFGQLRQKQGIFRDALNRFHEHIRHVQLHSSRDSGHQQLRHRLGMFGLLAPNLHGLLVRGTIARVHQKPRRKLQKHIRDTLQRSPLHGFQEFPVQQGQHRKVSKKQLCIRRFDLFMLFNVRHKNFQKRI